ncbi:MAG: acetylxylan esterase [Fimbriiglobus sp.]|nr:acetylxylan esterase [Fimbriiglobus sp.]
MLSRRDLLLASAASLVPVCTCSTLLAADAKDPTRIFYDGQKPTDFRLGKNKTLDDYFPFTPPKTKEEWAARRERVREQVMVATGLWPMPEKTPLNAVIHGKIERNGYTIEKVYFASTPGHYVCGNLYRPKAAGKHPAVLFAHGHWANARFREESEATAKAMVARGEEPDVERAKFFMQAIPATLAKLGFVVFQYDMVGYCDSTAIGHVSKSGVPAVDGFADAEGELRLHSLMGLQTLNSVRAVDFLCELNDVDETRIGVTGASGGGTQTFLLAAIDDRIKAAVPAVMVSTAMQGGCVCENCSLLRVGTGNIELAGLFAPRPQALPSANDWTKEIMTKGYPELRKLYKLLGAEDNISAKAWLKLPHNYGRPSREYMYGWFMKHLKGVEEEIPETPFVPVPVKELSVFDEKHPRPKDELKTPELRKAMTAADEKAVKAMKPDELRKALRAMVCSELPAEIAVRKGPVETKGDGWALHTALLGRTDEADAVPHAGLFGKKFDGSKVIVWVHPDGKASMFKDGTPSAAVQSLLDAGFAVIAPDVLGVGELILPNGFQVNKTYSGFTYGYNRSLLAHRVHDTLTTLAFAKSMLKAKEIGLVGIGEFGPVAILAKALAGDSVAKLVADRNGLDFAKITKTDDPMMLPGALKYGGLDAFVKLCGTSGVTIVNADGKQPAKPEDLVAKLLASGGR